MPEKPIQQTFATPEAVAFMLATTGASHLHSRTTSAPTICTAAPHFEHVHMSSLGNVEVANGELGLNQVGHRERTV